MLSLYFYFIKLTRQICSKFEKKIRTEDISSHRCSGGFRRSPDRSSSSLCRSRKGRGPPSCPCSTLRSSCWVLRQPSRTTGQSRSYEAKAILLEHSRCDALQ